MTKERFVEDAVPQIILLQSFCFFVDIITDLWYIKLVETSTSFGGAEIEGTV